MRVFLIALFVTVILAFGSIFALNTAQRTSATAYTTDGVRTNPAWTWRRIIRTSADLGKAGQAANSGTRVDPASMRQEQDEAPGAVCEQFGALKWLFVDFGDSNDSGDLAGCNA